MIAYGSTTPSLTNAVWGGRTGQRDCRRNFSRQNFYEAQIQNCETKQNLAGSSGCHHRDGVVWLGGIHCWLCINQWTQLAALYLQFSHIKQLVSHHRFYHQRLSGRWKPLASLGNCCSDCLGGQYLQRDIFWRNNYPVGGVSCRVCHFRGHRWWCFTFVQAENFGGHIFQCQR